MPFVMCFESKLSIIYIFGFSVKLFMKSTLDNLYRFIEEEPNTKSNTVGYTRLNI